MCCVDDDTAEPAFDGIFDADYLHFYLGMLTDELSDASADLIGRLLDLEPGTTVLDLACGHGRIANRLAAPGCVVTGLDASDAFLDLARQDAVARGVSVHYVRGDMRRLPWTAQFEGVVSWFTAYGYFDDQQNRTVLAEVARALRPGGRLLIGPNNRDWIVRNLQPNPWTPLGDGLSAISAAPLDRVTSKLTPPGPITRDDIVRHTTYVIRHFTFTELRDWLLDAGFSAVDGYDERGGLLSMESRRMIVVARR